MIAKLPEQQRRHSGALYRQSMRCGNSCRALLADLSTPKDQSITNLSPNSTVPTRAMFTRSWLLFLVLMLITTGCKPTSPEPSELVHPIFQFKLDGQPLNDAQVIFLPKLSEDQDGKYQPWSYGVTDTQGRLELRTSERSVGVLPGTHWVIISRQLPGDRLTADVDRDEMAHNAYQITMALENEQIPKQFNWPSRLQIEVPAVVQKESVIPIELTSELSTGFAPK